MRIASIPTVGRIACALAAFAALSVARPTRALDQDVVIVLDNSGSMRTNDPRRLARAAVEQLISRQDPGTRVALIVFAEEARLEVPLVVLDEASRAQFREGLGTLNYRGQHTNLPTAIERAVYHLREEGREDVRRSILFLTDGRVDTGDPEEDRRLEQWLETGLVESANDSDIRLHGIAFTEDADYRLIETVTRRSHGTYVRAFVPEALSAAFERIERESVEPVALAARPEPQTPPAAAAVDPVPSEEPAVLPPVTGPPAAPTDGPIRRVLRGMIGGAVALLAILTVALLVSRRRRAAPTRSSAVQLPTAFLIDAAGVSGKARHDLAETTVLGRKASSRAVASIVIDSHTVSRRHATIRFRDGAFWIRDHETRNGTFVNGTRIRGQETRLVPGDRIRIDKMELLFDLESWEDDEDEATRFAYDAEDDEATQFSYESPLER